jgi:3-oxoacyl-[acyl-carrier-protein] synthase-3
MSAARGVGMRSLSVSFPPVVRTNDFWREHHPEMVATVGDKNLQRIWSPQENGPAPNFVAAMEPYLPDPFRGAVERRVLPPGGTALSIELPAAHGALAAAGMGPQDIDLLIVSSFLPDSVGIGNAALVAKALGVRCPAWNVETACSSALVALEQACALVRTGAYRKALVVVSCTYSRVTPVTDTLSWSVGDGATAFVVSELGPGEGLLSTKTVNTAEHCGAIYYELEAGAAGPEIHMHAAKGAGVALQQTSEDAVVECCHGAAEAAGVSMSDIDFFAVPTPVAWYADFCARALGFPPEKTLSMHALYANTGPVLTLTNLYYAARQGKIRPGSLLMLYTVGIVSNASAAVVRWGDVALGPAPSPA